MTDSLKQKADQPNESTEKARKALSTNLTTKKESSYNTNLQGLSYDANVWEVREDMVCIVMPSEKEIVSFCQHQQVKTLSSKQM